MPAGACRDVFAMSTLAWNTKARQEGSACHDQWPSHARHLSRVRLSSRASRASGNPRIQLEMFAMQLAACPALGGLGLSSARARPCRPRALRVRSQQQRESDAPQANAWGALLGALAATSLVGVLALATVLHWGGRGPGRPSIRNCAATWRQQRVAICPL